MSFRIFVEVLEKLQLQLQPLYFPQQLGCHLILPQVPEWSGLCPVSAVPLEEIHIKLGKRICNHKEGGRSIDIN